ncbi:MAG TPA: ABC transporter ATP-binding protein [Pyrinomonadaceae bacterium]|jgi:lipopolysaccharide transport system ATP-binding protein
MKLALRVDHVSKKYRIGSRRAAYPTLRDALMETMQAPIRRLRNGQGGQTYETIWALRDVCLEVRAAEVVGIVGHNGAGKSTLLKIISRITEPTSGRVELYGRIGSLLEVGTGFHAELTGRENIFLNGAILGMRKAEIERKFDEIVAFSEIEKFIDTPVKFYSSGMYVRLAFSVAAHLEPDILLIDEVLSVGDMAFQQKCIEKISDIRGQTKAIILVSHSMISVQAICSRVVLFNDGTIQADGEPKQVIPLYQKLMRERVGTVKSRNEEAEGVGLVQISAVQLLDAGGLEREVFEVGEKITVVIEYEAVERLEEVIVYAAIRRHDGFVCVGTSTKLENLTLPPLEGPGVIEIEIPELVVMPGHYVMDVVFYDRNFEYRTYFFGRRKTEFEVRSSRPAFDAWHGVFYQKQHWKINSRRCEPGAEASTISRSLD